MKEKKFVETFCTECGKKIVLEERTLRDKRRTGKCQSCSLLGNKNHTTWRLEREVKRNEQKETAAS